MTAYFLSLFIRSPSLVILPFFLPPLFYSFPFLLFLILSSFCSLSSFSTFWLSSIILFVYICIYICNVNIYSIMKYTFIIYLLHIIYVIIDFIFTIMYFLYLLYLNVKFIKIVLNYIYSIIYTLHLLYSIYIVPYVLCIMYYIYICLYYICIHFYMDIFSFLFFFLFDTFAFKLK